MHEDAAAPVLVANYRDEKFTDCSVLGHGGTTP
jgi:hypothetical protein